MKKAIIFFLLLISTLISTAQDLTQLETQADEWSKKSFTQSKALSGYLACFRQTKDKDVRLRVMDKMCMVINNKRILLSKDVIVVDSLLDEGRNYFGKDTKHYLPLLEQRIIKASNSAGKYQKEFLLCDEAIQIRTANRLLDGRDYELLLRWYVGKLIYKREMPKEDKLKAYANLWEVYRKNSPGLDSLDIKLLDSYALQCSLCKEPQTSVMLHELKKEYVIMKNGKDSEEYMKILQSLCLDYSNLYSLRNPQDSYKMTTEKEKELGYRIEMYQLKKSKGQEIASSDVGSMLYNLTAYKKDTLAARQLAKDYSTMVKTTHGDESKEYCESLKLIVGTFDTSDVNAIPFLKELLALQEKLYGKESLEYKATEGQLTRAYTQNHQLQSAIDLQSKTAEGDNIVSMMQLATSQSQYAQYSEAIETYNKMMEYCATHPEARATYFLISVLGVVNCYGYLHDMEGLLNYGTRWLSDSRFNDDEQKFIFMSIANRASLPGSADEKSLQFVDDYMLKHPSYNATPLGRAEVMEQKASVFLGMQQPQQAETIIRQILSFLRPAGVDPRYIVKYEQYLEVCMIAQNKVDEAIVQNQKALSLMSQLPGYKNYVEYLALCCRSAIYQDQKDHFDEVLRWCDDVDNFDAQKATQMFVNASFRFDTFTMLTSGLTSSSVEKPRFRALYKKGTKDKAEALVKNEAKKKEDLLKFTLSRLDNSHQQNTSTWTKEFNDIISNVSALTQSDSLAMYTFNYSLLYKQAFLFAESVMRQQLLGSDNADVKAKFEELQNLRTTIQQQEAAGLSTQNLTVRKNQLERQLVEDSKMYGDFTKGLNLTWEQVRNNLQSTDMVIEYMSYTSFDDDKEHIAALLLRSDWKAPRFIHLFSVAQLSDNVYNKEFSMMCWQPLMQYMNGVKNVYISPAGILYNIGIESLPTPDGQRFISDDFNIFRISSARELIPTDYNKEDLSSAVVYGGLDYETSVDKLQFDAKQYTIAASLSKEAKSTLRDVRAAMSSIPYLPGSKTEVEDINNIIKSAKNHVNVYLLTGPDGTELSVLALNGKPIDILHISTHGFYNAEKVSDKVPSLFYIPQLDTEDKALTRSGLLMAGAQTLIDEETTHSGVGDGILTAQEISTLDLHHVKIVALSACQTGQGVITGDGVFGLQRGFKKAGVQSILMSLWNVDDEATCMLMTEFYRNWIGDGKRKHDALEAAKRTVRSHKEKGWDAPKYWAAFILLDALD